MVHSKRFLELVEGLRTRVHEIDVRQLRSMLENGEPMTLIDIREDHEWDLGHIPGAHHLGKGIIERDIEALVPDTGAHVVLYCGGGFRSVLAADALHQMGYANVSSVAGGWRGWNAMLENSTPQEIPSALSMERTLCMIKPDAVRANVIGEIIAMITGAGFRILGMKMVAMSGRDAERFYEVHRERPFYGDLVRFMSSGPVVAIALEKENAVAEYRKLIGATDPAEAEDGTVRRRYAASKSENAVHGSDSVENGRAEVAFFFAERELI